MISGYVKLNILKGKKKRPNPLPRGKGPPEGEPFPGGPFYPCPWAEGFFSSP